jgi:MFS family permease
MLMMIIGPKSFVWVALSYTLTSAVCLTLVGRVSDIFRQRWVFVGAAALGVIGASTQLSYYYVMGELVPMKYRLAGYAVVYMSQIPGSGIALVVANSFILYHPKVGWRGHFYILIAVNAIALICWVLFWNPPTFHMKHGNERMIKYAKEFDYVGGILCTRGLVSAMSCRLSNRQDYCCFFLFEDSIPFADLIFF